MDSIKHQSIKAYNTFGIELLTDLIIINSVDMLHTFLTHNTRDYYIIGGGSNILFTDDFDQLLLKNELKGIDIVEEHDESVLLNVASGEVWHDFVLWSLDHHFYGIENLSLIPGTLGAAPIQNIGAYGVEIEDVLSYVEYIDLNSLEMVRLDASDCKLGYRDSIFKNELKSKCFITAVGIKLSKIAQPKISYGAIQEKLSSLNIVQPTPKDISNAIIDIRSSKLPDPKEIGNAGSFFKNISVSLGTIRDLKSLYPDIPHYPTEIDLFKIPTAWLIDQCGWKGKRIHNTGTHINHALVIVNYGNATGNEIVSLAEDIKTSVWEKFGLEIIPEVNIV